MYRLTISMAVAGLLCAPALAEAQTKTVTLDGLQADIAVTPSGDMSKDILGASKQDILDLASKATPMVVIRPAAPMGTDQVAH